MRRRAGKLTEQCAHSSVGKRVSVIVRRDRDVHCLASKFDDPFRDMRWTGGIDFGPPALSVLCQN
jgi:hypothetical protein